MPFLTQGKTNWKLLLIVIILAIIVGGGALWYAKRPEKSYQPVEIQKPETANWKTYKNEEYGFEVSYPAEWVAKEEKGQWIPPMIMIALLSPEAVEQKSGACGVSVRAIAINIDQWMTEQERVSPDLGIETVNIRKMNINGGQGYEIIEKHEDKHIYSVVFGSDDYYKMPDKVTTILQVPALEDQISAECKENRDQIISTFKFLE